MSASSHLTAFNNCSHLSSRSKMTTFKAIVAREPTTPMTTNWSLQDVQINKPGDDEVLVEIHASGICHTDIVLSVVPDGWMGVHYPKIVGHEGAGIALEVGKNITNISPGDPILLSYNSCSTCFQCQDSHPSYCESFTQRNYIGTDDSTTLESGEKAWTRFFGQSSFAQYSIVEKASIINAKDLIKDVSELRLFAPLGCGFMTGMGAIQNITATTAKDAVFVTGLGAVGMGAVMVSRLFVIPLEKHLKLMGKTAVNLGVKTIIVLDRVKSRLEHAKELGATHIIDGSASDFTGVADALKALGPVGPSVVIETTGVPEILEQSIKGSRLRARIVIVGVPPIGWDLKLNGTEHLNSGRAIHGCLVGDCDSRETVPQLIKWYHEGKFPIDRFIEFFDATEYEKALASMKAGDVIKPVIVWKK